MTVQLALVEDQAFTRKTTLAILRRRYGPDAELAGFATVEELLAVGAARFDLVILDLQLREGDLEGAAAVAAVARRAPVLVFSALASGEALEQAQLAGARGYVSKDTADEQALIAGIEAVREGATYTDPDLLARIGASARKQLTPRQQQVLRLEALGCKLQQIALALELSVPGVRRHLERIVEIHPDCAKQADRVRLAVKLGLVSPFEVSQRHSGMAGTSDATEQ